MIINVPNPIIEPGRDLVLNIFRNYHSKHGDVLLILSVKTYILYSKVISLPNYATEQEVRIPAEDISLLNGGVMSLSLYDTRNTEPIERRDEAFFWSDPIESFEYKQIAERLVFGKPANHLDLKLTLDKDSY